jgi:hypothetical protein
MSLENGILLELRKFLAERQGFEPWEPFRGSTVFETVPFDHSGIAPRVWLAGAIISGR